MVALSNSGITYRWSCKGKPETSGIHVNRDEIGYCYPVGGAPGDRCFYPEQGLAFRYVHGSMLAHLYEKKNEEAIAN